MIKMVEIKTKVFSMHGLNCWQRDWISEKLREISEEATAKHFELNQTSGYFIHEGKEYMGNAILIETNVWLMERIEKIMTDAAGLVFNRFGVGF
jgi:hypothetical protein